MTATVPFEAPTTDVQNDRLQVTGYTSRNQRRDRGAELAHEARAFVRRFLHLPSDADLDTFVLWGIATNLVDSSKRLTLESFPLLYLGSDEPGSGKTRGVDMQDLVLCGNGKKVAMPTKASILGYIQRSQHAILLDESDTLFGNGSDSKHIRGIMLDSYTAGGVIPTGNRSAPGGVEEVDVHVPFLWAGIRKRLMSDPLLHALRTRTLCVTFRKPPETVRVEKFRRQVHLPQATMIRDALAKWGRLNASLAGELIPTLPEDIRDRDADLWEPLYVAALLLGGDWPERCERACRELSRGEAGESEADAEPQTPLEWLLADMATVFAQRGNPDRLASREIVHGLLDLPSSPWRRWLDSDPDNVAVTGGKAIASTVAARGVTPGVMKVDGLPVRGYDRQTLLEAGMPDLPAVNDEEETAAW
jgi:hypothetical protein